MHVITLLLNEWEFISIINCACYSVTYMGTRPLNREPCYHTGQCKRTGGCYNELVVAFLRTGDGLKGKFIYTCWLYDLFISLHLFYLLWHLAHRPSVPLQFMALPNNWWFNSWFWRQIQHSSGLCHGRCLFLVKLPKLSGIYMSKQSCYHVYM